MDIFIQSTKEFEKDLEGFSSLDKTIIINKMNRDFNLLIKDSDYLFKNNTLSQLQKIKLNHNYDSSLYSLRLDSQLRVILSIDNDPIFERVIVTLLELLNLLKHRKRIIQWQSLSTKT